MENKPIVMCAGNQELYKRLHDNLVVQLMKENVEWIMQHSRSNRNIKLNATFIQYNPQNLPDDNEYYLLGRTFFHIFWTDCDVDTYKSQTKKEMIDWLASLKEKNISDYLIVVIMSEESRVKAKILRNSVYDKVKSDFCSKQTDRCIIFSDPFKNDKSSEQSWLILLKRIRLLLLESISNCVFRFEENMRNERDGRNKLGWSFLNYFLLQEELAFMYEMLNLYDEALLQYDELDALFTQFVQNYAYGQCPEWLTNEMKDVETEDYSGIDLSVLIDLKKRTKIKNKRISLIDFRMYLFSRQCTLLLIMKNVSEVANRSLPFIYNSLKEIRVLNLKPAVIGADSSWALLTCLNIVQTCEPSNKETFDRQFSLCIALIRDFARKKMRCLGEILNLLPSENEDKLFNKDLAQKLCDLCLRNKETEIYRTIITALSSKVDFEKYYMDQCEMSMGVYKGLERIRHARMIGREMAIYLMKKKEYQKAEALLMEALKSYKTDKWHWLADDTRLKIVECQRNFISGSTYARSCMYVAASKSLEKDVRLNSQHEFIRIANEEGPLLVRFSPVFDIGRLWPKKISFSLYEPYLIDLVVFSHLLEEINIDLICLNLKLCDHNVQEDHEETKGVIKNILHRKPSNCLLLHNDSQVNLGKNLEWDVDVEKEKPGIKASIVTRGFSRQNSTASNNSSDTVQLDCTYELTKRGPIKLMPGKNCIELVGKFEKTGKYEMTQLRIEIKSLQFIKSLENLWTTEVRNFFDVEYKYPRISLERNDSEPFFTGIPNILHLNIYTASVKCKEENLFKIRLTNSEDDDLIDFPNESDLIIEPFECDQNIKKHVTFLAKLREDMAEVASIALTFDSLLLGSRNFRIELQKVLIIEHSMKIYSEKIFCQIIIRNNYIHPLILKSPTIHSDNCNFKYLCDLQSVTVLGENCSFFIFELTDKIIGEFKSVFSCEYSCEKEKFTGICKQFLEMNIIEKIFEVDIKTKNDLNEATVNDEFIDLEMEIKMLKDLTNSDLKIQYNINSNDFEYWLFEGQTEGSLQITDFVDGKAYLSFKAIAICCGVLSFPDIALSISDANSQRLLNKDEITKKYARKKLQINSKFIDTQPITVTL